jgi:Zn-dependent protease with chaperone function
MGILAWQASVFAVLAAGVALALTAVLPVQRVSFDLGHVLHACPDVLQRRYQLVDGSWLHMASLAVALVTFLALVRALLVRGLAVHRGRTRQRDLLTLLVQRRDSLHGAHVLDHDVALAYCVPGGGGRIVVTTAALAALDERQMTAVMAHEHAHLDGRHDLVLFGADVTASAFPWSQFFRRAQRELSVLVEMLADDEGSRRSDPTSLATALVDLGQAPAPEGAVGAGGDTVERVERLLSGTRDLSLLRRAAVIGAAVALMLSPLAIAVAPAWVAHTGLCPR